MIIPVLTCHCSTSFNNKKKTYSIYCWIMAHLTSGFYVSLWPSLPHSPCESKTVQSENIKLFQVLLVMCKCRRNWISLHSHHQRQTDRQHVRPTPVNCLVYIHNCGNDLWNYAWQSPTMVERTNQPRTKQQTEPKWAAPNSESTHL